VKVPTFDQTLLMVSVFASGAIDCGYEPRSCQTKEYRIGICCFSAKNAALRRKSKDWLASFDEFFLPVSQRVEMNYIFSDTVRILYLSPQRNCQIVLKEQKQALFLSFLIVSSVKSALISLCDRLWVRAAVLSNKRI
jgi:hypothetical protein